RADIPVWIGVVDEGAECAVGGRRRGGGRRRPATLRDAAVDRRAGSAEHAERVARSEIERATRRLPGHGGKAVVAERETRGVVPERGARVGVEVAHHRVPFPGGGWLAELW